MRLSVRGRCGPSANMSSAFESRPELAAAVTRAGMSWLRGIGSLRRCSSSLLSSEWSGTDSSSLSISSCSKSASASLDWGDSDVNSSLKIKSSGSRRWEPRTERNGTELGEGVEAGTNDLEKVTAVRIQTLEDTRGEYRKERMSFSISQVSLRMRTRA